ncbi:hypothetical protein [Salinarimonas soli]|uniref:Uncharacterized protein n=1 Tax=Salinarimonas soli TaxID=1638099 RepID=A0A5B2VD29_9HYPH|nr:hypothetical protein [Salinarimonas soli]KAA2236586.1 hypothetical protein F0L46_14025 [Salinarimonas soli]
MIFERYGGWVLLHLLSEWVIRIGLAVRIPARRSPEATRTWLLLALLLPWPALILDALIGRPTYPGWRRERYAGLSAWTTLQARHVATTAVLSRPPRASQPSGWAPTLPRKTR